MIKYSRKSFIQFLKYNIGGLLYFWSAWVIITYGTGKIGLFWANIIGNASGILLNYTVQRFWTFGGGRIGPKKSGWKFVTLTIVNLFLSYGILRGLTAIGVALWFAQFISAAIFTFWNWFWYKYWVFAAGSRKSGKR